jgi:hypothetical protein
MLRSSSGIGVVTLSILTAAGCYRVLRIARTAPIDAGSTLGPPNLGVALPAGVCAVSMRSKCCGSRSGTRSRDESNWGFARRRVMASIRTTKTRRELLTDAEAEALLRGDIRANQ